MLQIKLKRIPNCSSMVAYMLPAYPSLTALLGSKGSNSTFSGHGHVAYQIKGNLQMQQHGSKYFARRPSLDLLLGSKFNLSEHGVVAYQIKESLMQKHDSKYFACSIPHPGDGVKRSKFIFFQNIVMLHIQFMGIPNCSCMVVNILPADPPCPCCLGQKFKIQLFQNMVMLHIKLKGSSKLNSMVVNIFPADPSLSLLLGSKGQNSTFSEHGHTAYQF